MKVVFLPAAERDLGSLFIYIKDELHNEIAAHNIARKILHSADDLGRFPEIGTNLGNVDYKLDGYRHLLIDNYILVYKLSSSAIHVVRILYARSDYVQLLES